ncbi:unnamed protein product, partial [Rotaria sp. Silwood2]
SNTDVLKILDKQHANEAADNQSYLIEIIRTIVFLARQGVAFRGRYENDESLNRGNFLELLELRSIDNPLITKHLKKLKFTDYKTQNEIIDLVRQEVSNGILNNSERSKYFSVMVDETTDITTVLIKIP